MRYEKTGIQLVLKGLDLILYLKRMYIKLLFGCVFQYLLPSINDNDSRLLNLFFLFFFGLHVVFVCVCCTDVSAQSKISNLADKLRIQQPVARRHHQVSFLISIRARRVLSLETKQPQLSATPLCVRMRRWSKGSTCPINVKV